MNGHIITLQSADWFGFYAKRPLNFQRREYFCIEIPFRKSVWWLIGIHRIWLIFLYVWDFWWQRCFSLLKNEYLTNVSMHLSFWAHTNKLSNMYVGFFLFAFAAPKYIMKPHPFGMMCIHLHILDYSRRSCVMLSSKTHKLIECKFLVYLYLLFFFLYR